MSTLHLRDFAKDRGQPEAASLLGLTQGALSKAIRVGRHIIVTHQADGTYTAEERRPFPARSEAKAKPTNAPTLNANLRANPPLNKSSDDAGVLSSTGGA
ncbi:Cro/CI family transcriptional regulator [Pseudomonas syringae group genomosp. 7]|uniref:Cro/CI family transcriptional regulator n=1 Tax=Pseudomonas syringae group genomosp. 7 TaxID=251699 RepID=UPI0009EBC6CA